MPSTLAALELTFDVSGFVSRLSLPEEQHGKRRAASVVLKTLRCLWTE